MFWNPLKKIGKARALAILIILIIAAFVATLIGSPNATQTPAPIGITFNSISELDGWRWYDEYYGNGPLCTTTFEVKKEALEPDIGVGPDHLDFECSKGGINAGTEADFPVAEISLQQNVSNSWDYLYPFMEHVPPLPDPAKAAPKPEAGDAPSTFNWRDYNGGDWTTPAKNQGGCGSCWDFAALGALEAVINIEEGDPDLDLDLSEQYVLSCLPAAGSCSGGHSYSAFVYIQSEEADGNYVNGIIPGFCFPYQADHSVPCSDKCPDWQSQLMPISGSGYWYPSLPSERDAIKTQLIEKGPLVTSMTATDDFMYWGSTHHDPDDYYPYPGPVGGTNHAVVIVGYKDDPSIGNGGYWIVKNSWGTSFGYGGFYNVEYGGLHHGEFITYVEYEPQEAKWTLMVYLDGDNNLDNFGDHDFNEMQAGASSWVNVIVLKDDSGYGDTHLFYLQPEGSVELNPSWLDDEENMGDESTLEDFVSWAMDDYPAEHTFLVIWDHGGAWVGVCWDDTSGSDHLTMLEVKNALDRALDGEKIDIIGFDDCLMANVGVCYQLKDYADYLIGSEKDSWASPFVGTTWRYGDIIEYLETHTNPSDVAQYVVNNVIDNTPLSLILQSHTWSAIDLRRINELVDDVNDFALELQNYLSQYELEVAAARDNTESYMGPYANQYGRIIDLYHFAENIYNDTSLPSTLRNRAQDVINKINAAVIVERHHQGLLDESVHNAHGISIYFPDEDWKYDSGYANLDFPVDTNWDEFLTWYFAPMVVYTIATSPSGLQVEVDGTSYTAPASFEWTPGSSHTINASSPQSGGTGMRYVYASWSDGGAQSHTITVGTSDRTITAYFNTQYQLTMATNYGATNPSVGAYWYDAGSSVQISAISPIPMPGERYVWNGWTGSGNGSYTSTDNPATITMNGPITQTASWTHQYQLTMATNYGATNPSVGAYWYDAGSSVQISATAPSAGTGERYVWNGWTGSGNGSYTSTDNPATITMNGPITQTTSWTHQFWASITTTGLSPSHPATISVVQYGVMDNPTTSAAWSDWADAGSTLTISNPVTVPPSERYSTLDPTSWTVDAALTPTVDYFHQFLATIATDGLSPSHPATISVVQYGMTDNPPTFATWSDWADAGSPLTISNPITVSPTERYHTLDTASWTVDSALMPTVNYSHQFWATITTTGLSPSHPATIDVVRYGVTNNPTTSATWSDWADAGSPLTISHPVTVSPTERYHTLDTTSWTVTGPTTYSVTYYQQFKPTISAVTAGTGHTDLSATNYATLTYYRYGSSGTFNVFDAQSYNDWIDAGSTATLSNPSSGSTSTHRWYCPGTTSWIIDNANPRGAAYHEQFKVTITPSGLNPSYPATITVVQNGATNNPTAYASWSDWADIGSTLTISNPVAVSSTERYYTLNITSWMVNSAITPTVSYVHQFWVTIATTGLSPSHPAMITFMQHGVTNNPTTSATWSDWADAGSTLSISSSVEGGWIGDWSTGGTTSWTVNSAISATVGYQRSYTGIYVLVGGVVGGAGVGIGIFIMIRRRRARPVVL